MNKKTKIIVTLIVLVLVGFGIFAKSNEASKITDDIKLGSILILSGEGASWGEASKNGIDLAVKEINSKGGVNGKKISVIHEDNASDPKKAISAFKKLTETNQVKFIIGPNWSNSGVSLIDLAKTSKTVVVSPSLGVKEFNESSEYLFNTWPHDYILSRNLADYVYAKGLRNVALIGGQDVWVKEQTRNFKERFIEIGGKVTVTFEPQTDIKDVRTELLKIKSDKNIDAMILTASGYSLISTAAKQAREIGVTLPKYSITIDKKIISDCEGACNEMTFLTFLTPTQQFEKVYKDTYKREVEIGADSGYDAVMMIVEAMNKTGSINPDVVAKAMAEVKTYEGSSGKLVSDGKRGFTKAYLIKKVIGSVPVTIAE